jgi:hypothetical protein
MQPADALLRDLDVMVRTLIAGAVRPAAKSTPMKTTRRKAVRSKRGDRK